MTWPSWVCRSCGASGRHEPWCKTHRAGDIVACPRAAQARGWEQYKNCRAEDVPPGIAWHPSDFSPNGYSVHYGGPWTVQTVWSWGAPFRRIVVHKTGKVIYARYRKTSAPSEEREIA